jgi:CRP/FNR family cyclic AMP-dependent transcriptional regulator
MASGVDRHLRPKARAAAFDAQAFLESAGVAKDVVTFARAETLFSQGDEADTVLYIRSGGVKLSVASRIGREAIVAMLGPGDFCGEGAIAGQPLRMATASALTSTVALVIPKAEMQRVLHEEHALSDRFIAYMLSRNIRIEEDLIDQLFNSSEKRLARALLLLARYGSDQTPNRQLPKVSQAALAGMVGTTSSRVNVFLTKFKRLGFIDDSPEGFTVNRSLLSVVLHD